MKTEIGVAVKEGIVTLSGSVDSYSKKIAAEKATKKVAGVKAVAENIEVRFPGSPRPTDAEIAHAIMDALKWHTAVRENDIKVKVENGWVTLEGETEWRYQKDAREEHNSIP